MQVSSRMDVEKVRPWKPHSSWRFQLFGLFLMSAVGLWQLIQDPFPLWAVGMAMVTALFLNQDTQLTKLERRWVCILMTLVVACPLFFAHIEPSHAFIWSKLEGTLKTFASNAAGGSTQSKTADFISFAFNAMRLAFFGGFIAAIFQGYNSYRQSEEFGVFANSMVGIATVVGLVEAGSQVLLPGLSTGGSST
jgi:hypothetical protein